MSGQPMAPLATSATIAASAAAVSMSSVMPSARPSGAAPIQPVAVRTNTTGVPRCERVQGVAGERSSGGRLRLPNAGRSSRKSIPTISHSKNSTSGTPKRNHSAKPVPTCAAANALGGLPTRVPMPPMPAL